MADETDPLTNLAERAPQVFRKILGYLPIPDRIRSERVSSIWWNHCKWSVLRQPGIIDFGDASFKKMDRKAFLGLLRYIQENLIGVRFVGETHMNPTEPEHMNVMDFVQIFTQLVYPKVCIVNASWRPMDNPPQDEYCNMVAVAIGCCPALKMLIVSIADISHSMLKLQNVNANLQSFTGSYHFADPTLLAWFGGHCRQLRSIECDMDIDMEETAMHIDHFRGFFKECRQLSAISIYRTADIVSPQLRHRTSAMSRILLKVPEFWTLGHVRQLTKIGLTGHQFIVRVAESFSLLKKLEITASATVTAASITALANLSHLRSLSIKDGKNSVSAGLIAIAAKGKLHKLELDGCVLDDFDCLLQVISRCHGLTELNLKQLYRRPTVTNCTALIDQILRSLRTSGTLHVTFTDNETVMGREKKDIWDEPDVRKLAEKMSNNRRITGTIGNMAL